jgi:hypothetical protein
VASSSMIDEDEVVCIESSNYIFSEFSSYTFCRC